MAIEQYFRRVDLQHTEYAPTISAIEQYFRRIDLHHTEYAILKIQYGKNVSDSKTNDKIGAVDICARISRAIVAAKEYLRYEPV
jgi:hypothetical protein